MNAGRIVVSYSGVHQAFQLALAAQELGELKAFYCSLYDAPGKRGARFGGMLGRGLFEGRRVDALDLEKIVEYPWPLIWKATRDRFYRRGIDNWLSVNDAFDRWVARRIAASPPAIFVGTATSDLRCLEVAKRHGTFVVHDCPSLHPHFISRLLEEAADRAGIKARKRRFPRLNRGEMGLRKIGEYALADILLVYSEFHKKSFEEAGHSGERVFMSPLWVDKSLWYRNSPKPRDRTAPDRPLKLLFVGTISLRKGIPFLLKAVADCGNAVQLTIVGPRESQSALMLGKATSNVTCLPPQPKSQLRETYEAHDVLVLPSVGDPFPFVPLEAMACGLPVIMTENCGTPVPDASWKVPAMDSGSLAKRLLQYADDRTLVAEHGREALAFAAQFAPEKYRRSIGALLADILNDRKTFDPAE